MRLSSGPREPLPQFKGELTEVKLAGNSPLAMKATAIE
jgi:hypothetical protein